MKIRPIYILLAAVLVASCSCGGGSSSNADGDKSQAVVYQEFPAVEAPEMISEPQEKINYLAEHFWDRFTAASFTGPCDSITIKGVQKEAFARQYMFWATVLKRSSASSIKKGVEKLISAAEAEALADSTSNFFENAVEYAEKYLYDPNSPALNEEAYLVFLQRLMTSPLVDPDLLPSYAFAANICSLNRPGSPAADFSFLTKDGKIRTLYSVKAPVILLFFSNPGCPLCASYQEALENNIFLQDKIASKELVVVNIYPDADVDAWEEYVRHYPSTWVCGRDHLGKLRAELVYGLRAIPSLYVLDADKKVIAKDVNYEDAERTLQDLLVENII